MNSTNQAWRANCFSELDASETEHHQDRLSLGFYKQCGEEIDPTKGLTGDGTWFGEACEIVKSSFDAKTKEWTALIIMTELGGSTMVTLDEFQGRIEIGLEFTVFDSDGEPWRYSVRSIQQIK